MVKHLQAVFRVEDKALSAATDLRALGASEVTSDRMAGDAAYFSGETAAVIPMLPVQQGQLTGTTYTGQPNNVFFAGGLLSDRVGLFPEEHGRAERDGEPVVTAVVEDYAYDKAADIVRRHGGKVV